MKYLLMFLIVLSFIGPSVEDGKSFGSVFKDGFYNYITCLDDSVDYLTENIPVFANLSDISYKNLYNNVMKDKHLTKHLVVSGETLDSIIKIYNQDIDNIENFRKVVYKENDGLVSDTYELQAGQYITIPSD